MFEMLKCEKNDEMVVGLGPASVSYGIVGEIKNKTIDVRIISRGETSDAKSAGNRYTM